MTGRSIDERVTFRFEALLPIVNDNCDGKKENDVKEDVDCGRDCKM